MILIKFRLKLIISSFDSKKWAIDIFIPQIIQTAQEGVQASYSIGIWGFFA
jgi:hypothetical protein